ncbi:PLP-dependent transferase [Lentithecium fluviatile CBS 122367]|uniref:PLP-dependent transferase n=1 Tax=Lentithecium fluviatile CBS 122367 TaxID=1168545 RepID=A0A6G1JCV5_9PLEO|nr:PLP-dependent transferase [Lentithecium fluviatile CBS 122367]
MDDQPPLTPLETKLKHLLTQRHTNSTLRTLTLTSPSQADFSSNDFLSLSTNSSLKSSFLQELHRADLPLGSGGSRLLDGNSHYAERLERDVASFHGAEAGLLFTSGFDANAGFFACVPQRGDVVVFDALVHASVHDGMRLSRSAKTIPFEHNSVADLRRVLTSLVEGEELGAGRAGREGKAHVFVAVEAVYSMDGDVAPLREIVDTVEDVLGDGKGGGGGYVVVDEAHATGVLGPGGRGLVCALGLERRVFARLHTFGKALAGNGAIILTSPTLRTYLLNYARPLIYTTSLPFSSLALIRTSYAFLRSPPHAPLAAHLHALIQTLFHLLTSPARSPAFTSQLRLPSTCPQSPIFSIQLQDPKALASFLQKREMMVRAVVPPTVPEGTQRVRVCLHAGNTVEDVRRLVGAMGEWCEEQARLADRAKDGGGRELEEGERKEEVVLARL